MAHAGQDDKLGGVPGPVACQSLERGARDGDRHCHVICAPDERDRACERVQLRLVALGDRATEHLAHHPDRGRVVRRSVASSGTLQALLAEETRPVQQPHPPVRERRSARGPDAQERHTGEHEGPHGLRPRRREVERDAAAEGMADNHDREVHLLQDRPDVRRVVRRSPRLWRGRRGSEAREVDRDRAELRSARRAQHGIEVAMGATPAVKGEHRRLVAPRPGAEQPSAREGAQHAAHPLHPLFSAPFGAHVRPHSRVRALWREQPLLRTVVGSPQGRRAPQGSLDVDSVAGVFASFDATSRPDVARLLADLEPAQREAVLANDPVVCVLAGAGTGKTRVLTLRVARRVRDQSAHPSHVLVCTFSRKAAQELRGRLWTLGVGEVEAGTFHRTALRLIAHYRRDRGDAPPRIVEDRRRWLADLLDAGAASRARGRAPSFRPSRRNASEGDDAGRLDAEIGWAKSQLVAPGDYEEAARRAGRRPAIPAARIAELYGLYEDARRVRGVLDLDDLLWHCGDLLEQDPRFTRAMRWWHRHLFVDEMQDLNDAQYRLLRLLVGEEPDLFVVGDPNQSVYGWNGAHPELLRRVTEELAGTRVVRLETNHRCAAPVVRVASAVLGSEPPASARGEGPLPIVACLQDDAEEARWVARHAWLAHRPGRRWSSIAVLARTNAQLARLAEALDAEHVPYRISGAELGPGSDVRGAHEGPRKPTAREDELLGEDHPTDHGGADEVADGAHRTSGAPSGLGETPDADDAVVLSTFHRSKGLQWRTVFVVGVSDGLVPLVSARSGAAKAEERRLFYVALTRAEEELTCTWALRPDASAPDGTAERRPSPWLPAVERAVGELRKEAAVAGPAQAAEHLAKMRDLLARPPAGSDGTPG